MGGTHEERKQMTVASGLAAYRKRLQKKTPRGGLAGGVIFRQESEKRDDRASLKLGLSTVYKMPP